MNLCISPFIVTSNKCICAHVNIHVYVHVDIHVYVHVHVNIHVYVHVLCMYMYTGVGVRVVSNAGGVNPEACVTALREAAQEQGVELTVAMVTGDEFIDKVNDECSVFKTSVCVEGERDPGSEASSFSHKARARTIKCMLEVIDVLHCT